MKKVIGVISAVLFIVVFLQSCAAGIINVTNASDEASGTAGIMLAVCMLIAGILSFISKASKGITITAAVFYVLGGLVGLGNVGRFADLQIWAVLNIIFAGMLIYNIKKYPELYSKK